MVILLFSTYLNYLIMYKLILLLSILPVLSYAQQKSNQELYLNDKGEILTVKTDIKLIKNKDLSRGYALCYDGIDNKNVAVKQLNMNLHIADSLKTAKNSAYIKGSNEFNDYLIGDYKNGKAFNGFFKSNPEWEDWLMFDFYENGQLVSQLYNNKPHTILEEKDTEMAYTTLDAKNSFQNGLLADGIKIQNVKLKGGGAEIISYIKNGENDSFLIGIYGMHYGEFISIKNLNDGFLFESKGRGTTKITFTPGGRKIELFDKDKKPAYVVALKQYDLANLTGLDQKKPFSFIGKNNKIYAEQVIMEKALLNEEQREGLGNNSMLNNLSMHFYSKVSVEPQLLENILKDKHWGSGVFFGKHYFSDGQPEGFLYTKGETEGKYNVAFILSPESTDKKFSFKNLTPQEILNKLRAADN